MGKYKHITRYSEASEEWRRVFKEYESLHCFGECDEDGCICDDKDTRLKCILIRYDLRELAELLERYQFQPRFNI
jgi:hypothetical protein